MPPLNPLALATLGLLVERPMHPYEMFQLLIDRSEDRLVKVRRGTLYHAVARLTETGLTTVVGTDREGNRPERTTYAITATGRAALDDTVRAQLADPEPDYPMFPLALAQAHNLPRDVVVTALNRRIDDLAAESALLDSGVADARARNVPQRYLVDADYQHAMRRTELAWLRRFVTELADGTIDWHPPGAGNPYPDATPTHTRLENAGSSA